MTNKSLKLKLIIPFKIEFPEATEKIIVRPEPLKDLYIVLAEHHPLKLF